MGLGEGTHLSQDRPHPQELKIKNKAVTQEVDPDPAGVHKKSKHVTFGVLAHLRSLKPLTYIVPARSTNTCTKVTQVTHIASTNQDKTGQTHTPQTNTN